MRRTGFIIALAIVSLQGGLSQCLADDGAQSKLGHPLSGGEADFKAKSDLMRAIRDNKLSQDAQNITITADHSNGSTILRGYVKDDKEKMAIANFAHQSGCDTVVNELKVRSSNNTSRARRAKPMVIYNTHH